jgi:KaiC/GvpD/RAD55 family RecA-like ATPase
VHKYVKDNIEFFASREPEVRLYKQVGDNFEETTSPVSGDYPLYRQDEFTSDNKTVFFCETEEEADRLWAIGYQATAFCHERTDWKPLEKYKTIFTGNSNIFVQEVLKKAAYKVSELVDNQSIASVPQDELEQFIAKNRLDILPSISLQDLLALPDTPELFLLKPFWPEKENVLLYGPTGSGKTKIAQMLAFSVATGTPVFKFTPEEPKGVIYVDAEMTRNQIKKRLQIICNTFPDAQHFENLRILSRDDLLKNMEMPDIFYEEGREMIETLIRPDTKLLILDNLSCLYSGDENSNTDFAVVQRWLIKLKTQGVSVLLVHHSGKFFEGTSTFRGASRIIDTVCESIELTLPESLVDLSYWRANINFKKKRYIHGYDALPFQVFVEKDSVGFESWNWRDYQTMREFDLDELSTLLNKIQARKSLGWLKTCKELNLDVEQYNKLQSKYIKKLM